MNYGFRRTDIAYELIEDNKKMMFEDGSKSFIANYTNDIVKHVVTLSKDNIYDRPKGRYVTIDSPLLTFGSRSAIDGTIDQVYYELKKFIQNKKNILIVGIGNKGQVADSLGPRVVKNIEEF